MVEKSCDTCAYMTNHALKEPCASCNGNFVNFFAMSDKVEIDKDALNAELINLRAQVARLQKSIDEKNALPCQLQVIDGRHVYIKMMSDDKVESGMYWLYKAGD